MVEFSLNQRTCLGMDEGFKSFEPEVEHDFVKQLRSFVALSASARPSAAPEIVDVDHACLRLGHTKGDITERVYRRIGALAKPTK